MATNSTPVLVVEYASAGSWNSPASWVDITTSVSAINISRGRSYEMDAPEAGTLTFSLDNSNGDFTPGRAGRAHPLFDIGTVVRVRSTNTGQISTLATATVEDISISTGLSVATISCVDYFKQLGARQMPNVYRSTILATSGLSTYLPMDTGGSLYDVTDPVLSVGPSALSFSVGRSKVTSVGRVTGGADAPLIASRTGGSFTFNRQVVAADNSNWSWLESDPVPSGVFTGDFSIEFWFKAAPEVTGGDSGHLFTLATRSTPVDGATFSIAVTSSAITVNGQARFGQSTLKSYAANLRDDAWHHFAFTYFQRVTGPDTGPFVTKQFSHLYIDGVQTDADAGSTLLQRLITPDDGRMFVGGGAMNPDGSRQGFRGEIAHLAVYTGNMANASDHNAIGRGTLTETELTRFYRLGSMVGVDTWSDLSAGLYTLASMDYGDSWTVLDALKQVVTTDAQGSLFVDGSGTLRYISQRAIENPTTAYTFTVDSISAPDAGLVFDASDSRLINICNVTGSDETAQTAQDAASVARFGPRGADLASTQTTPDARMQLAAWIVARQGSTGVRLDEVSLSPSTVADGSLWPAALGIEVGTCITVANLPAYAPAASMDLVIEGLKHSITQTGGAFEWQTTLSTSPKPTVWVLEDAKYGLLDSSAMLAY